MKTILFTIISILMIGCSTHEHVEKEIVLDVPINLLQDDELENREYSYAVLNNRLVINSIFDECQRDNNQTNGLCVEFDVRNIENRNIITAIYRTYKKKEVRIQVEFPATVKYYSSSRHRHIMMKKYQGDLNELPLFGNPNENEYNLEDIAEYAQSRFLLDQEEGFTYDELLLIQKDIATLHDKYTPYRRLRVIND